jgi:hypothetical protein
VINAPPITNTNAQETPRAQGTPSVSEGASLPPTPRAEQLLIALAAADFDTAKILATGAFTIIEIADLTADETFQKRQAALMSLKKTALTLQAIEARQACMKALKHVVEATEDLVEKRRAATALLRATTAALIPTTERQPRTQKETDKQPDPPPDPPKPKHAPDPDYSATDVVHIIAHAARNAAEPENTDLATIAAFASETATIDDQPFAPEDPEDQDALNDSIDMLAHSSLAVLRGTQSLWPSNKPTESPTQHTHFRGYYVKKTDSRHELIITLTKSQAPDSRAPDCWLVSALTVRRLLPQY